MLEGHLGVFFGLDVVEVDGDTEITEEPRAYRVSLAYDEAYEDVQHETVDPALPPEPGLIPSIKRFFGMGDARLLEPSTHTA